jgi:hypothetical protein
MTHQLIACTWNDAHGSDGTVATHELEHKPYRYTTVGFLVRSDGEGVSIAHEHAEDGKWRQVSFIPRAMIVEEQLIGPYPKRPRRPRRAVLATTTAPLT